MMEEEEGGGGGEGEGRVEGGGKEGEKEKEKEEKGEREEEEEEVEEEVERRRKVPTSTVMEPMMALWWPSRVSRATWRPTQQLFSITRIFLNIENLNYVFVILMYIWMIDSCNKSSQQKRALSLTIVNSSNKQIKVTYFTPFPSP